MIWNANLVNVSQQLILEAIWCNQPAKWFISTWHIDTFFILHQELVPKWAMIPYLLLWYWCPYLFSYRTLCFIRHWRAPWIVEEQTLLGAFIYLVLCMPEGWKKINRDRVVLCLSSSYIVLSSEKQVTMKMMEWNTASGAGEATYH